MTAEAGPPPLHKETWEQATARWTEQHAGPGRGDATAAAIRRVVTFRRLEVASAVHSCVYLALLVCAFAAGSPQPETFVLGLAHGLLWIGMSLVCIVAVRLRIIPLRVGVAVAVLGGVGPFFGTVEFVREERRRARCAAAGT